MATDRKQKTIETLRQALHICGPDAYDTKIAAIQCCYAYGLDPYYRYALWPRVSPKVDAGVLEGPLAVPSVEEWQRMINRAQSRR